MTTPSDLRSLALAATQNLREYEAWEMPSPPPAKPMSYGGTADVIDSLLDERDADKARIEVLEKALREAGRVLAQPEIYSIWPVAALRMEIATLLNDTETAA